MTDYSALRKSGKLYGTIKRAKELRKQRDRLQESYYPQKRLELIPLPSELRSMAMSNAYDRYPRRKNWLTPSPDATSKRPTVQEIDNGRYSSRCKYTHWTYRPQIRCCGIVTKKRLLWFHGENKTLMFAPKGWKFGRDNLGLYIVRNKENRVEFRYHFSGDDLVNKSTLRNAAIEHERTQIESAKRKTEESRNAKKIAKLKKLALKLGVFVTARDSVNSGNCGVGTKRWADDHGFDIRKSYPMETILRAGKMNGNKYQVERACEAALLRTVKDLDKGYCELV